MTPEIKLPSGWAVENANGETPIYLYFWENGQVVFRREITDKNAQLVSVALADASLRRSFHMRSGE
jgi:hypothetical protein